MPSHASTVLLWPFPKELISHILLLPSRLSFLNDGRWTWDLIGTSTHKSLWNQLGPNGCVHTQHLSSQTMPHFSPPICLDFGTHWSHWSDMHCNQQKQQEKHSTPPKGFSLKSATVFTKIQSLHLLGTQHQDQPGWGPGTWHQTPWAGSCTVTSGLLSCKCSSMPMWHS